MRIGIFGGSFDPPHKGHIAIARKAMNQLKLNQIYFIPAYLPPHKLGNSSTLAYHRLKMLKLSIKGIKNFYVSDIEIKRRGVSYTVDTLKLFKKRFPESDLFLLIGMDNLAQFKSWKSPETILQLSKIAVYKRKGYCHFGKKIAIDYVLIKGEQHNISSTEIRNRIRKGMLISKHVKKAVEEYIKQNELYIELSPNRKKCNEVNCSKR